DAQLCAARDREHPSLSEPACGRRSALTHSGGYLPTEPAAGIRIKIRAAAGQGIAARAEEKENQEDDGTQEEKTSSLMMLALPVPAQALASHSRAWRCASAIWALLISLAM